MAVAKEYRKWRLYYKEKVSNKLNLLDAVCYA